MNVPFLDLKAQYDSIKNDIDPAIADVISSGGFIGGKKVTDFEKAFAEYNGSPFCLGVANGTDAIEIAIKSLGLSSNAEVIVPANTFIATSEAVTSAGAKVVFADSHPDYYTLDIEDFKRKITPNTKAVIPVHLYGQPADMDPILEIAKEHNLFVIEDTSQAHGATYKGRKCGSMGDIGTFSFYPGKNLGAYGDAGGILFKDEKHFEFARTYAAHGSKIKYVHEIEGRNSRLDSLQAAVLHTKLPHLDKWSKSRLNNALLYNELLSGVEGIITPKIAEGTTPVFHLYVVRVEAREAFINALKEKGITAMIHYPFSLPKCEAYKHYNHAENDFPVANSQMNNIVTLPMYPELSEDMIRYVCESIKEILMVNA